MSHNLVQLVQIAQRHKDSSGHIATAQGNAVDRLKTIMHARREISADDIRIIARELHEPEAAVYGVATYYGDLGMQRRGRTRVRPRRCIPRSP